MTSPLTAPSTGKATGYTTVVGLITGALAAIGVIDGGGGGAWTDVLASFGLSESTLGPAFATQSAFVFPVLLLGGMLLVRLGMRAMMVIGALMLAATSFAFLEMNGIVFFIALFAVRGTGLALLDLSGNTMAMHVERETGTYIMGIVHAGFSFGIVAGSLIAFVVYALGGSFRLIHALLGAVMLLVAVGALLGPVPPVDQADARQSLSLKAYRLPLVRICGIALGVAFGAELLISQWVSVLLRTRIEASDTTSVLAVVIYATMMAFGRLANGPLMRRIPATRLLAIQGTVLAAGGLMISLATSVPLTLAGSFVGGLGVAGVVPTVLSYAATHTRTSAGETAGASLIGGYFGALLVPLLAGGLTSLFSLRVGVGLIVVMGVLTVACGVLLKRDAGHRGSTGIAGYAP